MRISRRNSLWLAPAIGASIAAACQKKANEHSDVKRMPKPPPPPHVEVPAGLRIAVEIDGREAAPLDAAKLKATTPDFQDDDHRAWKLSSLLGAPAERDRVVLDVSGERGPSVVMRPTHVASDAQPVLTLSRRGDVVATMVTPAEPFPDYHGRGGQLGRGGDPLPHISGVTKIRVHVERDGG